MEVYKSRERTEQHIEEFIESALGLKKKIDRDPEACYVDELLYFLTTYELILTLWRPKNSRIKLIKQNKNDNV
jgi:hypothetical protein